MPTVRAVIALSTFFASKLKVKGSMSTKTGRAPQARIASTAAAPSPRPPNNCIDSGGVTGCERSLDGTPRVLGRGSRERAVQVLGRRHRAPAVENAACVRQGQHARLEVALRMLDLPVRPPLQELEVAPVQVDADPVVPLESVEGIGIDVVAVDRDHAIRTVRRRGHVLEEVPAVASLPA